MSRDTVAKRIMETWDEVEDEFPDKSTEWLIQMTCDRYTIKYGKEIDNADVVSALADNYYNSE